MCEAVLASTTFTLSEGKIILCRLEELVGRAIFRTLDSIFPRFPADDEMTVLRGRIGIPPLLVNLTSCLS